MRLKQKIVLSNAIVFSALIIISVFFNFFYAANIFSTNLNNKNKLKAKLIAQEIDEWLIEKKTVIEQTETTSEKKQKNRRIHHETQLHTM